MIRCSEWLPKPTKLCTSVAQLIEPQHPLLDHPLVCHEFHGRSLAHWFPRVVSPELPHGQVATIPDSTEQIQITKERRSMGDLVGFVPGTVAADGHLHLARDKAWVRNGTRYGITFDTYQPISGAGNNVSIYRVCLDSLNSQRPDVPDSVVPLLGQIDFAPPNPSGDDQRAVASVAQTWT